jgi:hypothetical protein
MSRIPAHDTKHNPDEPEELEHVCVTPANRAYDDSESALLRSRRRPMRVKPCSVCPYTPRDLAGHYDPEAVLHVCAKCDEKPGASTNYHPRKIHRRQQCETFPNNPGTAQPSGARSATESSASYDTTPGEPPSVRRNALIASRRARTVTADGCFDFRPPDSDRGEAPAVFSSKVRIPEQQAADTVFRSALGGGT